MSCTFEITEQAFDQTPHLANAWLALAKTYAPPSSWGPELPELLKVAFGAFGGELAEQAARLVLLIDESQQDSVEVEVTHARLFVGPYEVRAPAYASLYLDPERTLMGQTSREAAKYYADAGLGPGEGPRDAPDHVITELEFMYYLRFQEVRSSDDRWTTLRLGFWQEHLSRWLPQMVALVLEQSQHPLYETLARLTREVIALEEQATAAAG